MISIDDVPRNGLLINQSDVDHLKKRLFVHGSIVDSEYNKMALAPLVWGLANGVFRADGKLEL